jgi:GNAT superfamily N-acetyltransferase
MSAITIRAALPGELELLLQWREEVLRDVFSIADGAALQKLMDANRAYYSAALSSGGHAACFAALDGETVGCGGMCLYSEMPSPDNPGGACAYLMNIYTRPAFRGMGVGRGIVNWLTDLAREKGAGKIYLEATEGGRALYRSLGFYDMENYMKLK